MLNEKETKDAGQVKKKIAHGFCSLLPWLISIHPFGFQLIRHSLGEDVLDLLI